MTIDEAKRLLSNYLDGVTNYCERDLTDEAIQVAIATMRKYQKIEQIVKPLKELAIDEMSNIEREILGVIENGSK